MPTSDNSVLHDALAIVSTLPDHPKKLAGPVFGVTPGTTADP